MDAIVTSYTSSDSEEEKEREPNSMSNAYNLQSQIKHDEDHISKPIKLPILSEQCLSLHPSMSAQSIPVSLSSCDSSQHTDDAVTEDAMNTVCTQETKTFRVQSQIKSTPMVSCSVKKHSVMPYIPKAKRTKFTCEEKHSDADPSSNWHYMLSSVFSRVKTFSKTNTSKFYPPKRKLVHFDAHQGCINRISWNPCFQDFILSASMDGVVKVWNVETRPLCVQKVNGHKHAVKDAKWSMDGVKVLSGGYDRFARITDINAGKEVCANNHNSFVTCVLYHPSDSNVYLSGTSNDGIYAWDVRMAQHISRYKSFFGQIQDLTFLPDGQSFISAADVSRRNSTDKGIMVWDYKTMAVLSNQVFQEAYTCTSLKIHPTDSTFLVQCNAGYIAVFSQNSPYKLNKYKRFEGHCMSGYHIGMDISADGGLVASGSSDGSLYIYNYCSSQIMKTFPLDSRPCMDVAWSLNVPNLLASCDWNGIIFLHR